MNQHDSFNDQVVTISVLTYNSSKFIKETLESIKNQTYSKLILHICDDCSTDDSVDICKIWIAQNKDRFVSTEIIVPTHNTGVSANCNRMWDACTTTYHKEIAGDDILLPNCIADNMQYMNEHQETVFVFSRMKSFGVSVAENERIDAQYDYSLFELTSGEQFRRLYNGRFGIPAPTCFENIAKIRELGLRHDERIPMQEDVAKWINALKLGIRFAFFDKATVKYRIHEGSLSTASMPSPKSRESVALTWFYYHFVPEYEKNPDSAIKQAVAQQMNFYKLYYQRTNPVLNSKRYRLAILLLKPLDNLRSIWRKLTR